MSKPRSPKENLWRKMFRKESFLAEKRRCFYCKTLISFAKSTADHRIPLSKGGGTTRENINVACEPCNRLKGDMSESKFLSLVKKPPQCHKDIRFWLVWSRRKIALQTIRSCDNLEKMFIGCVVDEERRSMTPRLHSSRR